MLRVVVATNARTNPLNANMQKIKNLLHKNDNTAVNNNAAMNNGSVLPPAHANPLDRNHDGRVDLHDLTARNAAPGMMQTTTQTTTQTTMLNSGLDRNHDGIDDRLQGGRRLSNGQMMGQPALDRNHDGIDDRLQTGLVGGIDRNHDGIDDRLQGGRRLSQGYDATLINQQGVYVQSERRASLVRAEPTIIETIQKDVVVHERIHPVEKEEIQPIIYREREQLDVKQVTQMLHETQIQPTIVQQRELAAEVRAPIVERGAVIEENLHFATSTRDATLRTQQVHAPIVEETIKKTVIQEIQPVLERDVFVPTIVQNTQPIYEKIVEAPVVYRETRDMRSNSREYIQQAPIYTQPIIQETVVMPRETITLPAAAPKVEYVTMATTTTTNETFVPAKLVQEGELRNWQPAAGQVAPINRV